MAAFANFPEDIMIEILSMIPVGSLHRLRFVCKSWYALICDPGFTRKHLSNSPQHEHVLLKRRVSTKYPKPQNTEQMENIFSIFKNPFSSSDRFESFFDVHLQLDENFMNFVICGHSHGVLCLSDTFAIFLCNPTTGEFRKLPPCIHLLTEDPNVYGLDPHMVRFGYNLKSNDFKVVRVVDFYGSGDRQYSRVEIYDLSKDRWRETEIRVCDYVSLPPYLQMYSEGAYYWCANDLLAFDMSEEVFYRILVPDEVKGQRSYGVLNGSILIISYDLHTLDIWKMNDHESMGLSWSKLFAINYFVIEIKQPLLFVSFDELLVETKHGLVILCNIKTHHYKQLPIKGHPLIFQATFFVKSLMSVKGGMKGSLTAN